MALCLLLYTKKLKPGELNSTPTEGAHGPIQGAGVAAMAVSRSLIRLKVSTGIKARS